MMDIHHLTFYYIHGYSKTLNFLECHIRIFNDKMSEINENFYVDKPYISAKCNICKKSKSKFVSIHELKVQDFYQTYLKISPY